MGPATPVSRSYCLNTSKRSPFSPTHRIKSRSNSLFVLSLVTYHRVQFLEIFPSRCSNEKCLTTSSTPWFLHSGTRIPVVPGHHIPTSAGLGRLLTNNFDWSEDLRHLVRITDSLKSAGRAGQQWLRMQQSRLAAMLSVRLWRRVL